MGLRHAHGLVHGRGHHRHPRVDYPQLPDARRNSSALSGVGKGRRHRGRPELGRLPRRPHRAGGAGRRLLYNTRGRAFEIHSRGGKAHGWYCFARRLNHGEMDSRPQPRKLPLRALGRHLRHHVSLRHRVLNRRRTPPRGYRRRQRLRPARRACRSGRAYKTRVELRRSGHVRRPGARSAPND